MTVTVSGHSLVTSYHLSFSFALTCRFPLCRWSPIPLITWFLPFIGHTGIADSSGVIYDFGMSVSEQRRAEKSRIEDILVLTVSVDIPFCLVKGILSCCELCCTVLYSHLFARSYVLSLV